MKLGKELELNAHIFDLTNTLQKNGSLKVNCFPEIRKFKGDNLENWRNPRQNICVKLYYSALYKPENFVAK